jgi:hypothetical protein
MSDPTNASHKARLNFERFSGYMMAGLVAVYGSIGLWSKDMADRIVELAPALTQLATVLGGVMAASWFRGHMDNRLDQPQGDK